MTERRNCIIIHGCPSDTPEETHPETRTYDKHWIPWTKRELSARGIPTETPRMPEPWAPSYKRFKKEFEQYFIGEHTILIGHSCGTMFLLRWLADTKQRVDTLILVAPWAIHTGDDHARKKFYGVDIDPEIKARVERIIIFTSDNETPEGKASAAKIHDAIGGSVIELPGRGHYTRRHMGTEKFPELIEEILAGM